MFPIECYGCGNTFDTLKVTASLKCARCGSNDLDLIDKTAQQGGTGWGQPQSDHLKGWNEYQGPLPGRNPQSAADVVSGAAADGSLPCQACKGTGYDGRASGGGYDEFSCRNCHGTGRQSSSTGTPSTTQNSPAAGPEVGGARQIAAKATLPNGKKAKATVRANALPLKGASCPSCSSTATKLARDAKNHAWWHCASCGPLADLDETPGVNPFGKNAGLKPMSKFATKANAHNGKVFKMVEDVIRVNSGISTAQALTLVRAALLKYPEGN